LKEDPGGTLRLDGAEKSVGICSVMFDVKKYTHA
jgi:hypothetical protein